MKKLILTSAFLLTMLSAVPVLTDFTGTLPEIMASDRGEPIGYNDMVFIYREGRENELMLWNYSGKEPNLVIPEKINGYTVTAIGDDVFSDNKGQGFTVENVTLPDTIDYFGFGIFSNSTLVSVNIPESLRLIPAYTFRKCKNLETIVFHNNILAVSSNAFVDTDITLPQNIQDMMSIDDDNLKMNSEYHYNTKDDTFTFGIDTDKDTHNLYCTIDGYIGESSEIIIPQDFRRVPIKYIDFSNTDKSKITSLTFPETTNEISVISNSFNESLITELNINSPCILNANAFANCKNLKTITFKNDATIDRRAFSGCTNLLSVEFDGKSDIEYYAFMDCSALENITVDTTDTTQGNISGDAFNGCLSLANINSEPVFDSDTGDFNPKYSDFVKNNFYMAEDIGFINEYAKAQYKKIADEVTNPDMSDIEKVKALHDWVCENTKYADDLNKPEYHTDASILLNDSTVCEGYAKALNLLLNYAGVETYYVHSENHAWNIVKIGGHYFHVDSTWDDGDTISHKFFMKSDSEIKDDGSHSSWSAYIPTSLHNFQKSGTPECKYQVGDTNTDGAISVADAVKMTNYLLNAETETADNIILYDLDFDGKTDVFDMILMRQKFLNN